MSFHWRNIFRSNKINALILLYHRIASPTIDPWDLCVSKENFEEQIKYLSKNFKVVSMDELVDNIKHGSAKKNIAITFDDGYEDNFSLAKPILEAYQIPATFYITSSFQKGSPATYWWDDLENIILSTKSLPKNLEIDINNEKFSFNLSHDHIIKSAVEKQIGEWKGGENFSNKRIALYYTLWSKLKPLQFEEQNKVIDLLKTWTSCRELTSPKLMETQQLKSLSNNKLFTLGGHTSNHLALGLHSIEDQQYEIEQNKILIESVISNTINGFAYPYGHYNSHTPEIVARAGFKYAVSTVEGAVKNEFKLYQLPRVQIKNWSGKSFETQITAWLNSR